MRTAASLALGLFVGCLPLYGMQAWICLAVALLLRLDFLVAFAATWVNNPLTGPLLVALEVEIGALLWTGRWMPVSVREARAHGLGHLVGYATLGSVAVGALVAVLGALCVLLLARRKARGR